MIAVCMQIGVWLSCRLLLHGHILALRRCVNMNTHIATVILRRLYFSPNLETSFPEPHAMLPSSPIHGIMRN
jgi:hypothetical protein